MLPCGFARRSSDFIPPRLLPGGARLHPALRTTLSGAVYFAMARRELSPLPRRPAVASVWPPAGFLLALVLRMTWREVLALTLTVFLADVSLEVGVHRKPCPQHSASASRTRSSRYSTHARARSPGVHPAGRAQLPVARQHRRCGRLGPLGG